mgnify:CR=1 FL=1|jgi:hypothetical protein
MDRITICDATLTLGSGALGTALTVSEKLRMAHELTALGVDVIEVGYIPNDRDLIRRMSLLDGAGFTSRLPILSTVSRVGKVWRQRSGSIEWRSRSRSHEPLKRVT